MGPIDMYHIGTADQFNEWHVRVKEAENIPSDGRVGYKAGKLSPNTQRTTVYSVAVSHPTIAGTYIWQYGNYPDDKITPVSELEAKVAGFFLEDIE